MCRLKKARCRFTSSVGVGALRLEEEEEAMVALAVVEAAGEDCSRKKHEKKTLGLIVALAISEG
jgi:hypothetical protein